MSWQSFLIRFAGDPHQRFRLFIAGLFLFALALVQLYAGLQLGPEHAWSVWLTRVGTFTLLPAFGLCGYCYLSLLINRLLHFWQD